MVCLIVQGVFWLALYQGFRRARRRASEVVAESRTELPVAVIVAARDEEAAIPELLRALSASAYRAFEVVIVDDGSTDRTADIVRGHMTNDDRVRVVQVTPREPRKKNALTAGIESARHELLAFTDADCRPGPLWLSAIAAHHGSRDRERVIVGWGPLDRTPGIVNRVARYENFVTAFLTAAACGLGRPYMALGRNLSYSRTLFRTIDGFRHSIESLSGDDDLLVQEVAQLRAAEVVYMFDPNSFVPSPAPKSWRSWLRQKRRHASAGRYYRPSLQLYLLVFHVTGIALWLAPFWLGLAGAAMLAARLVVQHAAVRDAARTFGELDLLPLQPLWELAFTVYNLVVAPVGVLFKPRTWHTGAKR